MNIMVLCSDPGGTNALCPVLPLLKKIPNTKVHVYGYNQACEIWEEKRLPFSSINIKTQKEAVSFLAVNKINLLVTGTAVNRIEMEKMFWRAAKKIKIPSMAILDFWSHYRKRFENKQGNLDLPDKIAIMDIRAYQEMIKEGFPAERLVITGQPVFDDIISWRSAFIKNKQKNICKMRRQIKVKDDEKLILFFSQPFIEQNGADPTHPNYLGFTEIKVIRMLISVLDEISMENTFPVHLLIRPHPRETVNKFRQFYSPIIPITVSRRGTPREVIMAADIITGINSILLIEAAILEKVSISLQPGLKGNDVLPTNSNGMTIPVYDQKKITPLLKKYLLNSSTAVNNNLMEFGKAQNLVVEAINNLIFSYSTGTN